MLEALIGLCVLLLVVNLVVRDRIEYRISKLRTELMALRAEERRLGDRHKEVERLSAQIEEALDRAQRRGRSARQENEEMAYGLGRLYQTVLKVELSDEELRPPPPDPDEADEADEAQAEKAEGADEADETG